MVYFDNIFRFEKNRSHLFIGFQSNTSGVIAITQRAYEGRPESPYAMTQPFFFLVPHEIQGGILVDFFQTG